MDNKNDKQKISQGHDENICLDYCTFNIKGEFIICSEVNNQKILRIYSAQTKNNEWKRKRICNIPEKYKLISISKYNKLYLLLNNCIYERDIATRKNVKIFTDEDYEEVIKCVKLFN
jgi:hypothetical protein